MSTQTPPPPAAVNITDTPSPDFPPKSDPPLLAPNQIQTNVTADSSEIKSLLTSANLSTDNASQKMFLDSVFSQVLRGMSEMAQSATKPEVPSPPAPVKPTSVVPSVGHQDDFSLSSHGGESPSTPRSVAQAFATPFAKGPPTDLQEHIQNNFASRKNEITNGGSTPYATHQAPVPLRDSHPQPMIPTQVSRPHSHAVYTSCPSSGICVSSPSPIKDQVGGISSSTSASTFEGTHVHDSSSVPVPSPKPMVTFDVSKWTKESKDHTLEDETFDSILSWYDVLQQCMHIATGKTDLLPEINVLHPNFDFIHHILPSAQSSTYKAGMLQYTAMAKALRIYLARPETISTNCTVLVEMRKLHRKQRDGFTLLLLLLGAIFPHMGGPHLDIVNEISSIKMRSGETFDSLLHRFLDLDSKLSVSGHYVPATALFQRYIDLLQKNDKIFSLLSPIHRLFNFHLATKGPDVIFPDYSIHDIHKFIKNSNIATSSVILQNKNKNTYAITKKADFSQSNNELLRIPSHSDSSLQDPQSNAAAMAIDHAPRRTFRSHRETCPICFMSHSVTKCWVLGEKHQPHWLRKNVTKYKALHPSLQTPDDVYLNQPPPLRRSQYAQAPQANKSVNFDLPQTPLFEPSYINTPVASSSTTERIATSDSSITVYHPSPDESICSYEVTDGQHPSIDHPECNMADAVNKPLFGNDDESFYEA